jgi:uncharacterized protein (DUF2062 family)
MAIEVDLPEGRMSMTGPERRRRKGMWVALAIAIAVALGLFKGAAPGVTGAVALGSEVTVAAEGNVVVRVLAPVLY